VPGISYHEWNTWRDFRNKRVIFLSILRFIHAAPKEMTRMENVPVTKIMMKIQITANRNFRVSIINGQALAFHCCGIVQLLWSLVAKSTNNGWEVQGIMTRSYEILHCHAKYHCPCYWFC
jgi:hypothetical protein